MFCILLDDQLKPGVDFDGEYDAVNRIKLVLLTIEIYRVKRLSQCTILGVGGGSMSG